ncbi:MAG TPA: phage tail protein [Solirubrobacteraceae bacterium]|jgi:phage tail-like protein|nr:phage tail protein [Solirubrobacteraceae bacterium]
MPIKQQQFTPAIWFELKLTPKSTPIGYFTEVSGLSSEVEVMTYNEGGKNDGVHKLPTRMKHPNLVLKRGVTTVKDLQEWAQDSFAGPQRKEITLTMYNEQLEKIRIWSFKNAYPVKWTGPTFNAGQNAMATEVIEIAHDGIQVS